MNRISRIVAKQIILDSSNHLWNENEARILQRILLVDIPRAGDNDDFIDRDQAVKALKYNSELSDNAAYVAQRMVHKIPPAIIGIVNGNPNVKPEPLTIEQLRALAGDPVWIYNSTAGSCFWMLAYSDTCSNRIGHIDYNSYGKTWVAYGFPRFY